MTPTNITNIFEQAVLARVRDLHLYIGGLPTLGNLRSHMRAEIGGRRADKLIEEMVQRGVLVLSVDEGGRIWVGLSGEVS